MAAKENYHTIRYGNKDGELKFGHIHSDQTKSAFMVRSGSHPYHYMTMDADGNRTGWTINRCPGVYEIICADGENEESIGFYLEAVKGDIVIKATDGNIRLEGNNVQIIADGADNSNGIVRIEGKSAVDIRGKNIEVNGTATARFFCYGTTEVVGKRILNIYGGMAARATGASYIKTSKFYSDPEKYNQTEIQLGD